MTSVQSTKIWFQGGHLFCPKNGYDGLADLYVENGEITSIFNGLEHPDQQPPEDALVINVDGLWIGPGLVDFATHMRSPGNEEEEKLAETLQSAAFGGITTVVGLPTTQPTVETGEGRRHNGRARR